MNPTETVERCFGLDTVPKVQDNGLAFQFDQLRPTHIFQYVLFCCGHATSMCSVVHIVKHFLPREKEKHRDQG